MGHSYTPETLLTDQTHALEMALWASRRALEERASLLRRLADQSRARGGQLAAGRFDQHAREAQEHVDVLRRLLAADALFEPEDEDLDAERPLPSEG